MAKFKFESLHYTWFLNHSDNPNIVEKIIKSTPEITEYYSCKKIKKGDELLVDYKTICDEPFAAFDG